MCRRLIASLLLVSLAGAAQAQENMLADAADEQGGFTFPAVPPGRYSVRALGDERASALAEVEVEPGREAWIELRLE